MKRSHTTLTLAVAWVCSLLLSSCAETPPEPPPPPAPQVPTLTLTQSATVFDDSVIFQGTVNPNGQLTTAYFAYDTLAFYRYSTLAEILGSGVLPCTLRAVVRPLWRTRYNWRLSAQNWAGASSIEGSPFVYRSYPPDVSTCVGTSDTTGVADLTGALRPNGVQTTYHFEYDTTTQYRWKTGEEDAGSGSDWVNVQARVAGLYHRTQYFCRLVASSSAGTSSKEGTPFVTRGFLLERTFDFPSSVGSTWTYSYYDYSNSGGASGIHTWMCTGQESGGWRVLVARKDTVTGFGPQYPAVIDDSLSFVMTVDADSIHIPFPEWKGWFEVSVRVPRLSRSDSDTLRIVSIIGYNRAETVEYESGVGLRLYHAQYHGITESVERKLTLLSYHRE